MFHKMAIGKTFILLHLAIIIFRKIQPENYKIYSLGHFTVKLKLVQNKNTIKNTRHFFKFKNVFT